MKMLRQAAAIVIPALALIAVPETRAIVVFSETFESYAAALNQTNFGGNWTVSAGTVDIVNNFAGLPGNTVDLDGSSGDAGILTSISLPLIAGDYALTYLLAGSQRGDTNTVTVSIGGATQPHTLPSAQGQTLFTLNFTLGGPVNSSIVFSNAGGDNLGLLLDNVVLERRDSQPPSGVPDGGATFSLFGGALALVGLLRRRLAH